MVVTSMPCIRYNVALHLHLSMATTAQESYSLGFHISVTKVVYLTFFSEQQPAHAAAAATVAGADVDDLL